MVIFQVITRLIFFHLVLPHTWQIYGLTSVFVSSNEKFKNANRDPDDDQQKLRNMKIFYSIANKQSVGFIMHVLGKNQETISNYFLNNK